MQLPHKVPMLLSFTLAGFCLSAQAEAATASPLLDMRPVSLLDTSLDTSLEPAGDGQAKKNTKGKNVKGKNAKGKNAKGQNAKGKNAKGKKAASEGEQAAPEAAEQPAGEDGAEGEAGGSGAELAAALDSEEAADEVNEAFASDDGGDEASADAGALKLNRASAVLGLAIRAAKGAGSVGLYQGLDYDRVLPFGKPGMFRAGVALGGIVGKHSAVMVMATFSAEVIPRLQVTLGLGYELSVGGFGGVPDIDIGDDMDDDGGDDGDDGDDDDDDGGDGDDDMGDDEGDGDEDEGDGDDEGDDEDNFRGATVGYAAPNGTIYSHAFLIRLAAKYGFEVGPMLLGPTLNFDISIGKGGGSVVITPGAFLQLSF